MVVQVVGRRYAEAIFDIASESGNEAEWLDALESLAAAAGEDETRAFFANPAISDQQKESAFTAILPANVDQEIQNLARMLIRRRRFNHLPDILEAFEVMWLRAQGISIADVTTAVELTDAEQQYVSTQLGRIVGTDVRVRSHIDDAIIGGIVARIGDQLIDGSVRTQLRDLRSTLGRR